MIMTNEKAAANDLAIKQYALAVQLYAAAYEMDIEMARSALPVSAERIRFIRLAVFTFEREAAARKEALRECYNAVCREFIDKPIHDAGVRKCRDAIAKIIEGNEKWIKKK